MKTLLSSDTDRSLKSVMEEAKTKYTETIENEEEKEAFHNAWNNQNFDSLRKLLKRHVNILKEERGDPDLILKLAEKEEKHAREQEFIAMNKI